MQTVDHWIRTPLGRIFARVWAAPQGADPESPPIVMIHDSLGCVALWRDLPERIAMRTGRRVIAYDRPGFGRSHVRDTPLDAHGFIAGEASGAFRAVLDHFRIERFVVLGHSVGGCMAFGVAATYPDGCTAVISISAQSFVEERTLAGVRAAKPVFTRTDQRARLARYHGARVDWILDAWIGTWLSPGFTGWTLDSSLRGVHCPALVIHGGEDEYGSTAHPARIARIAPGPVERMTLPSDGHFPHRTSTDAVLSRTHSFLAAVP